MALATLPGSNLRMLDQTHQALQMVLTRYFFASGYR